MFGIYGVQKRLNYLIGRGFFLRKLYYFSSNEALWIRLCCTSLEEREERKLLKYSLKRHCKKDESWPIRSANAVFYVEKKIVVLSDQKAPTMFCYCPTSLSICPPFGIFGAFPYFIKVTHAVFSDRDKRKKVGKKDFPCRSENGMK